MTPSRLPSIPYERRYIRISMPWCLKPGIDPARSRSMKARKGHTSNVPERVGLRRSQSPDVDPRQDEAASQQEPDADRLVVEPR